MKLYNIYNVISNKIIRRHEKLYKRFPKSNILPGTLIKTNRGYFIDGKNVDQKSVDTYLESLKK